MASSYFTQPVSVQRRNQLITRVIWSIGVIVCILSVTVFVAREIREEQRAEALKAKQEAEAIKARDELIQAMNAKTAMLREETKRLNARADELKHELNRRRGLE